jgi:hypothetical protein
VLSNGSRLNKNSRTLGGPSLTTSGASGKSAVRGRIFGLSNEISLGGNEDGKYEELA